MKSGVRSRRRTLPWATADWGDSRRATWTRSPRRTSPRRATASATTTASSSRRSARRATRWSTRSTGSPSALPGRSSGRTCATRSSSTGTSTRARTPMGTPSWGWNARVSVDGVVRHAEGGGRGVRHADQRLQHEHDDQPAAVEGEPLLRAREPRG